jgi:cation diffusion facilitator family transporter
MNHKKELKKGQKVTEFAIILEGLLVVAKFIVGYLSGGVALISDAYHSGSDFISIITSWLGFKFAQKEADRQFQYGYYKAENLGTLIISFLILYAAFNMALQGYSKLFTVSEINLPIVALAVSLIDAIALFFFGKYEIKVGKDIGAESLISMGKENKTHILSSSAIFAGTLSAYLGIPYIEGAVTIIISILIFEIGFSSLKNAVYALMDVSPDEEFFQKVDEAINSIAGIEEYYDLKLRRSGPCVLGEVKIGVRKSIDVKRSKLLADKVEEAIKKKIDEVDSFNVSVVPFESEYSHIVFPVTEKKQLSSQLANTFGRADYLLFVNLQNDQIKGYYFLDNPYKKNKNKAGLLLAQLAAKQKANILITNQLGEIAFYTLHEHLFDIYKSSQKEVKKLIEEYIHEELPLLEEPTTKTNSSKD